MVYKTNLLPPTIDYIIYSTNLTGSDNSNQGKNLGYINNFSVNDTSVAPSINTFSGYTMIQIQYANGMAFGLGSDGVLWVTKNFVSFPPPSPEPESWVTVNLPPNLPTGAKITSINADPNTNASNMLCAISGTNCWSALIPSETQTPPRTLQWNQISNLKYIAYSNVNTFHVDSNNYNVIESVHLIILLQIIENLIKMQKNLKIF
jgi:hypothetical protein